MQTIRGAPNIPSTNRVVKLQRSKVNQNNTKREPTGLNMLRNSPKMASAHLQVFNTRMLKLYLSFDEIFK